MRSYVALVALAAIGLAGIVSAQDEGQGAERIRPRFHVGGAIGQSRIRTGLASLGAPAEILDHFGDRAVDSRNAWKVAVGFRPIRAVGVELQHLDLGDAEIPSPTGHAIVRTHVDMRSSADATVLAVLLFVPLPSTKFDVYGKLGVARLEETSDASALLVGSPCLPLACTFFNAVHETDSKPYFGIGFRHEITRSLAFRLEYEAIDRTAGDNGTMLSAGVAWER